jgi:hypothetical protein
MIRFLIFGVCVAILTLGWLLLSEVGDEHALGVKPFSESNVESDALIPPSQQASSNSPLSQSRENDIQASPSNPGKQPTDLISGVQSSSMNSPISSPKDFEKSRHATPFLQNTGSSKNSNSQISNPVAGVGRGAAPREISIPVPEGAKVPAVFFDAEEKPIVQQKALDRIAQEFEKNVTEIPQELTKEEVWEAARAIADERYLTLFGYQSFNQYHIESAKEALREKKALGKTTKP